MYERSQQVKVILKYLDMSVFLRNYSEYVTYPCYSSTQNFITHGLILMGATTSVGSCFKIEFPPNHATLNIKYTLHAHVLLTMI